MEEPLAMVGGTAVLVLVLDLKKTSPLQFSKKFFQQTKTLKPVIPIEAPSDVNTMLDGKVKDWLLKLCQETQLTKFGASAANLKLMEPDEKLLWMSV